MRKLLMALVLSGGLSAPLLAQGHAWRDKWYWGGQLGILQYKSPASPDWKQAVTVGGHWLITGSRSALYVAYDHVLFNIPSNDPGTSAVLDPSAPSGVRQVEFNRGRRIQAHLYVIPSDAFVQPYFGGGFSVHQVIDAEPLGSFNTASELEGVFRTIDDRNTKAYPVFTGGLQIRLAPLALFGHYQFMPEGRGFLLSGTQHVLSVGARIAVTSSREGVGRTR